MKRDMRDEMVTIENVVCLPNASLSFSVKEQFSRAPTDPCESLSELREIAERCRATLVFETDSSGVVWTNSFRLLGHKPEAFSGWQGAELNHPSERDANLGSYVLAQERGEAWSRILRLRDSGGSWHWVRAVACPVAAKRMIGTCHAVATSGRRWCSEGQRILKAAAVLAVLSLCGAASGSMIAHIMGDTMNITFTDDDSPIGKPSSQMLGLSA